MYEVLWRKEAVEDLRVSVTDGAVARELVHVANVALDDLPSPGHAGSRVPMYWHRGITAEWRTKLDADPSTVPDTTKSAADYVIYYKRCGRLLAAKWEILKVSRNSDILEVLLNLPS